MDTRRWFLSGVRVGLSGPAFYVALSLMGVGGLARAAGFPIGVGGAFHASDVGRPRPIAVFWRHRGEDRAPAIALAVSLSSVRLLPMCLSVLPMLRQKQTGLATLVAAAHFIAVTVWAESLRRLPEIDRPARPPFFFGLALTCMSLTTLFTMLGYWLIGSAAQRRWGPA